MTFNNSWLHYERQGLEKAYLSGGKRQSSPIEARKFSIQWWNSASMLIGYEKLSRENGCELQLQKLGIIVIVSGRLRIEAAENSS